MSFVRAAKSLGFDRLNSLQYRIFPDNASSLELDGHSRVIDGSQTHILRPIRGRRLGDGTETNCPETDLSRVETHGVPSSRGGRGRGRPERVEKQYAEALFSIRPLVCY